MTQREAHEVLQVPANAGWSSVRAAYLALARRYHPDGAAPNAQRMVELNAAYECLDRQRRAGPDAAHPWVSAGPGGAPAPAAERDPGPLLRRARATGRVETPVIDFGQYAGWRIAEVAECDPEYLRWLSRHSSGVRFRAAIQEVLGSQTEIGRRAALIY